MPSSWAPLGQAIEHRRQTQVPKDVYTTGYTSLDDMLGGGLHQGQFIIIGGGYGGGKSAFAENLALNTSLTIPTLFAPIEMGKSRTEDRLIAKVHKAPTNQFYRDLSSDDPQWSGEAQNTLRLLNQRHLGILHTATEEEARLSFLFEEAIKSRARVLMIDHIREVNGWIPLDGRPSFITQAHITRNIRDMAEKHGITTIVLQQLSPSRYDGKRRPSGWMLQDTSALAQRADVVLLVHQPFSEDADKNRIIEIIVDKNRNGPKGIIHLHWIGSTMSMLPMTPEEEQSAPCCQKPVTRGKQRMPYAED